MPQQDTDRDKTPVTKPKEMPANTGSASPDDVDTDLEDAHEATRRKE